ncbi:hypothetical protein M441DRAFT_266695 [Trichoderma asperellum CBS 433.97]|uniref:Uncharacterized protein n=1 Tax=Trichoderma asperellum (strain ATCC 204424 / CBS 433.97 / NBRC 101777) TaxID=1042311 RepID=A0A2T3YXX7_TRIA4|nr:hypothetical protein M441DRAFT_266695 [Trichoderma asperellum CBS 433.97]PTB37431.1 hypothetical protein M441DRAFT_266695 [Trichoderma asperellum CBS 433.97]
MPPTRRLHILSRNDEHRNVYYACIHIVPTSSYTQPAFQSQQVGTFVQAAPLRLFTVLSRNGSSAFLIYMYLQARITCQRPSVLLHWAPPHYPEANATRTVREKPPRRLPRTIKQLCRLASKKPSNSTSSTHLKSSDTHQTLINCSIICSRLVNNTYILSSRWTKICIGISVIFTKTTKVV